MKYLLQKIKELDIQSIYNFTINTNISKYLPYHNSSHLENVCEFSLRNAENYGASVDDQRKIAIAALFHDYNHTGSTAVDDINIELAIIGLEYYNINFTPIENCDEIIDLIKCTRYPYLTDGSELPVLGKMIRDADTLQGLFCQNYIFNVVYAIAEEKNIKISDMLNSQIGFMKSMKYLTKWAQDMANSKTDELVELVELAIETTHRFKF